MLKNFSSNINQSLLMLILLLFSFFIYSVLILLFLNKIYPLKLNHLSHSTIVTASDGTPMRAFADKNGIWRYPATVDQVSNLYLDALINYEDRWYYYHFGINPLSVVRAFIQNLIAGDTISGASTITMQVARLLSKSMQGLRAFNDKDFHISPMAGSLPQSKNESPDKL